jgi:hypothetical protein
MEPTNAFTQMAMASKPAKAAQPPMRHPELRGRITVTPAKPAPRQGTNRSSPPAPKQNPQTAVSGVPRAAKAHPERQLDGNRTQQFSKPVKKGGLAERQSSPAPHANSGDSRSGLEGAMAGLADQLHPRGRPKATMRKRDG